MATAWIIRIHFARDRKALAGWSSNYQIGPQSVWDFHVPDVSNDGAVPARIDSMATGKIRNGSIICYDCINIDVVRPEWLMARFYEAKIKSTRT